MTLTTAGPPPAGINWNAVILSYLELNFSPVFGMQTVPTTAFNVGLSPSLVMQTPGKTSIRLAPRFTFTTWVTSRSHSTFNIALAPSIGIKQQIDTSVGLTLTPSFRMSAAVVTKGRQVNGTVQRAATI